MMMALIVDDERMTRETLRDFVPWGDLGVGEVQTAENGADALEKISARMPDIIICDIRMPRMDGMELVARVRERNPDCRIIFLSGYSDKEYLKTAIRLQAADYIEKPINIGEISGAVERNLRAIRARADSTAENERTTKALRDLEPLLRQSLTAEPFEANAESLRTKLATVADVYLSRRPNSGVGHASTDSRIGCARDFLRAHCINPDLSVAKVAAHVGLSESYLCTFFKQECGVTVKDFVTQVRIEKAKDLLRNTSDKLHSVALSVGFRDANYFSTVFKRQVGLTPGEYRERCRR